MSNNIQMSVVIGFKNWGLNRLGLAIQSVQRSFGTIRGEVIVSDYGSDEFAETELLAKSLGAIYVYTPTDGTWSRSRALNIGFAHSSGEVLACTDADMIFKPGSMEKIYAAVRNDTKATILVECRDLPREWSDKEISQYGPNWDLFDRLGKLRGRWGMGGMVAVTKETFVKVRGLDERMHTYGCEDIDFGERTQRAGNKIVWLRDPSVRMFHMWHPPSGPAAEANPDELKVINANREILYNDRSYSRNTRQWLSATIADDPLVTISIATRNRAKYLPDAIHSVLSQTVQDFEIVIVDDGSTDNTREVVESFADARIRYIPQENRGIAAARNLAVREARGRYTAVLDDDDIMLPWRLEAQLASVGAGQHGSYGSFVNFDDASAEMTMFHEKQISVTTAFERGGAPGHSTWMVETELLRLVPYDESILSGEDNNLFLRLLRSGARLSHCKEVVVLRRLHKSQMTQTDDKVHERYATANKYFFRFNTPKTAFEEIEKIGRSIPWITVRGGRDIRSMVRPYLPDHLVKRTLVVNSAEISSEQMLDEIRKSVDGLVDVTRYSMDGRVQRQTIVVEKATYKTMALLRQLNVDYVVQLEDSPEDGPASGQRLDLLNTELASFVNESIPDVVASEDSVAILLVQSSEHPTELDTKQFVVSTSRITVGPDKYVVHVLTTESAVEAIAMMHRLSTVKGIKRIEMLTNNATKKAHDYLSEGFSQ